MDKYDRTSVTGIGKEEKKMITSLFFDHRETLEGPWCVKGLQEGSSWPEW